MLTVDGLAASYGLMILIWTLATGRFGSEDTFATTTNPMVSRSSGFRVVPTLIVSVLIALTDVEAWTRTGGPKDGSTEYCEVGSHPNQQSVITDPTATSIEERRRPDGRVKMETVENVLIRFLEDWRN